MHEDLIMSYEKFFEFPHWDPRFPRPEKDRAYLGSVALFVDYYKNTSYYLSGSTPYGFFNVTKRILTGAWNRKNIVAVANVMRDHNPCGLLEMGNNLKKKNKTLTQLLTDLNKELLSANKEINPNGELAKRIQYVQNRFNVQIINIQDLNNQIKSNQPKKKWYQF